jgi:hypothetical protein
MEMILTCRVTLTILMCPTILSGSSAIGTSGLAELPPEGTEMTDSPNTKHPAALKDVNCARSAALEALGVGHSRFEETSFPQTTRFLSPEFLVGLQLQPLCGRWATLFFDRSRRSR